jgi:hypothetical protein
MKNGPVAFIFETRIDYLNLYCLNLKVYVNAQFIVFQTFEDVLNALKNNSPDLMLIGLEDQDDPQDKMDRLDLVIGKKSSPPLSFVVGESKKRHKNFSIYDQTVPVKDVVSSIAKKMGITAKYMSELDLGEYYPIASRYILPGWQATKDIFVKNNKNEMELAIKEGQMFTGDFLKKLGDDGEIFCLSSKRLDVINSFISNIKSQLESKNLSVKERSIQTNFAFEMVSESVGQIGLPGTIIQLAKSTIKSIDSVAKSSPSIKKLYDEFLKDTNSIRFKKSVITTYLGQFMLADQTWNNPNITLQWSYLCFFHDILLTRDEYLFYSNDNEVKKSNLSDKEKELVLAHAQMAAQLLAQVKEAPVGIDMLVKQHHGSKMGNSLSETSLSISPLCVIFILVEKYALFLLSDDEKIKDQTDALIFVDELEKKYPYPNFKKMLPLLRTIPFK